MCVIITLPIAIFKVWGLQPRKCGRCFTEVEKMKHYFILFLYPYILYIIRKDTRHLYIYLYILPFNFLFLS